MPIFYHNQRTKKWDLNINISQTKRNSNRDSKSTKTDDNFHSMLVDLLNTVYIELVLFRLSGKNQCF